MIFKNLQKILKILQSYIKSGISLLYSFLL